MNNTNWSWGQGLDKAMKKIKSLKLIIINNNLHDYDQRRNNKKEQRKN